MAASTQISLGYVNAGQLYHVNPPTVGLDARGVVRVPEPPTFANMGAISKLKGGKAPGICGIPVDLLKAGCEPMALGLLLRLPFDKYHSPGRSVVIPL